MTTKISQRAATAASKVLRDGSSSKSAKTAAGSALSQSYKIVVHGPNFDEAMRKGGGGKVGRGDYKIVVTDASTAASRVLRNPDTSKLAKTLAGSALSQRSKK